nr:hypothetical protein BaRGS_029923 [Batillaria attramentaria]
MAYNENIAQISTRLVTVLASDAASTLKAIEADFWTWRLQDAPQFATAVGDPRHNDVLESYDISVYKEREWLNKWLSRYTARFDGDVNCLDQQIALLRHAISIGHTLNNVSVVSSVYYYYYYHYYYYYYYYYSLLLLPLLLLLLLLLQSTTTTTTVYYYYYYYCCLCVVVTMRSQAEAAVDEVYKALIRLKNVLEQEYIPAGRATWGVSGWPDGKALYEQCLKYHTSTDMTPQQVHDLGIREVQRIQTNMLEEALLDMFKDYIYNRITPKLNTLFKDIPDLPLKVEPMPYDGPGGIYLAGTPDGSVPGIFYANVMHPAQTWDRERAIQYFLDNTAESRDSMTTEVDRYLTWPGQATAYKVGEIRIRELRQKASDALGSKFDVREFHSVLLKNGGMPLNLLERLVDEWIADVTSGAAGVTSDSAGVTSGTSSTGPPRDTDWLYYVTRRANMAAGQCIFNRFEGEGLG